MLYLSRKQRVFQPHPAHIPYYRMESWSLPTGCYADNHNISETSARRNDDLSWDTHQHWPPTHSHLPHQTILDIPPKGAVTDTPVLVWFFETASALIMHFHNSPIAWNFLSDIIWLLPTCGIVHILLAVSYAMGTFYRVSSGIFSAEIFRMGSPLLTLYTGPLPDGGKKPHCYIWRLHYAYIALCCLHLTTRYHLTEWSRPIILIHPGCALLFPGFELSHRNVRLQLRFMIMPFVTFISWSVFFHGHVPWLWSCLRAVGLCASSVPWSCPSWSQNSDLLFVVRF